MNRHRMWWLGAALLAAGGCSSTPKQASDKPVDSGLNALFKDQANQNAGPKPDVDQMIANYQRGMAEADGLLNPPAQPRGAGAEAAASPEPAAEEVAQKPADPSPATAEATEDKPMSPEPSLQEQLRALTGEAAAVLRRIEGDDPYALALRLVALKAMGGEDVAGLEAMIAGLPIDERETVAALLGVLSGLEADPDKLADALAAKSEELSESRPMRISVLKLCSRVEGFGRYTELGGDAFMAGSPMRMIIYTELSHFDQTPVSEGSDGSDWEVKLGQELQLYHESDGLLAWRRPEEVTAYQTKSRLRDYFVVNQIELPRTLTVGAYRLKVVMRDLHDGSIDERVLPIRVVADPRIATGYGG
ncbi:MAG: hypothetical protein H6810_05565 [Phycisphaeraceae bacterium]|nr:MAG: hypothetical protein H6810_05565 [Phycisphaeraceae bacterium]